MTEDEALALLQQPNVDHQAIEKLGREPISRKSRKVLNAVIRHPKTPRHVSLPLTRHLFTFELMQVALTPTVPADVKLAAEDALISRLQTISAGERLALAKQGSSGIAAQLLLDSEPRIAESALDNPRLSEAAVERALQKDSTLLPQLVCRHSKWSLRKDLQFALLKNPHTPLAKVLEYADKLSDAKLKDALTHSRLSSNVQTYLKRILEGRKRRAR